MTVAPQATKEASIFVTHWRSIHHQCQIIVRSKNPASFSLFPFKASAYVMWFKMLRNFVIA